MTIRFYMDENVPRQITTGLRLRGIDTLTVQDDGLTGAADPQVLARATELQRVIFTRDDDFLVIAHQCQQDSTPFYGVVASVIVSVSFGHSRNSSFELNALKPCPAWMTPY
jgi:hypothetical protein